jgi:hypothetical protein
VLALGGVHDTVLWTLLLFYSLGAASVALGRIRTPRSLQWHPLWLAVILLVVLCALQAVPWPRSWVAEISPLAAQAQSQLDGVLGDGSAYAYLSLDVNATWQAAARWWTLLLALFWLAQGFADRRVRRNLPWIVLALAALVLGIGVIQQLAQADAVFGLITPAHINARVGMGGPFINPNHAAHFFLLAAMTAAALLARSSRSRRRTVVLTLLLAAFVIGMMVRRARRSAALPWAAWSCSCASAGSTTTTATDRASVAIGGGHGRSPGGHRPRCAAVPAVQEFFNLVSLGQLIEWTVEIARARLGGLRAAPWSGVGAGAFGGVQVALAPSIG